MKNKILITGTLGFIGSNFIRSVLEKHEEYKWVGVDKAIYDYSLKNNFKHKNYKFYLADIADEHIIDRIFSIEKPNIIINMAAESFVCNSIENPNPFIYSNVVGTQTLINASIKYRIDKFFQISTDEVYGSMLTLTDSSWTELNMTRPRNPYSASKLSAESILYAANQTHKLPFVITRCCNVFGPRQPSNRNLIPKSIVNIMLNQPMPIYGNGSHVREYIYVEDKINAIMHIINKCSCNEVYNIGTGNEFCNSDIVNIISKKLEKEVSIDYTKDRPGHDFRYSVNCSKLKETGWKLTHSFDEGMAKTINWYVNNREYFK